MSPSDPIAIPSSRATVSVASSSSSSSPSSGVYIPVHKRNDSSQPGSSYSSLSSVARPAIVKDTVDQGVFPITMPIELTGQQPSMRPAPTRNFVYTIEELLNLAQSPLSRQGISLEARDNIRENTPEILLNRKQRKAKEWHASEEAKRLKAVLPRRSRPVGRTTERRRNAQWLVDELSWRGRPVPAVPITI